MTHLNRRARPQKRGCRLILVLSILTIVAAGCQRSEPVSRPSAASTDVPSGRDAPVAHADKDRQRSSADSSSLDFSWLPPQSQLVVQVRVQELLKTPFVASVVRDNDLLSQPTALGVSINQIHSITGAAATATQAGGIPSFQKEMLIVVRTTAPVDVRAFENREDVERVSSTKWPLFRRRNAGTERAETGGLGPGGADPRAPDFTALAGPTTILMGSEQEVRAALSRGPGRPEKPGRFRFVRPGAQFVAATLIGEQAGPADFALGDTPPEVQQLLASVSRDARAIAITLALHEGVDVSLDLELRNARASEMVARQLHSVAELIRRWLDENRDAAAFYLPILNPLADNLQSSAEGNVASLRTQLSSEGAQQLSGFGRLLLALADAGAAGGNRVGRSLNDLHAEAVLAELADGVPEEMQLRLDARWTNSPLGSHEAIQPPPKLELVLLADKGRMADVVAFGDVELSSARFDDGERLKRAVDVFSELADGDLLHLARPESVLAAMGRGLSIPIQFHHPVGRPASVSELSGRVLFRLAGRRLDKQIANLRDWLDGRGDDPDLKGAGFEVFLSDEGPAGNVQSLVLLVDGSAVLTDLAVDGSGSALQANSFVEGKMLADGRSQYTISFSDGRPPDVVPVRFQLATELQDCDVAFRFKSVPLPKAEPLSADQQALVTWKPTLLDDTVPEGTSVEARARWSLTVGFDAEGRQVPRPLELAVDLIGEEARRAVAYGKLTVSEARTDAGPLDPSMAGDPRLREARQKLIAAERDFAWDEYPPDGMQAVYSFAAPEKAAHSVTQFAGSLTMVTAARRQEVLVPSVLGKGPGPFTTPELESRGIELELQRFGEDLTVSVVKGLAEQIGDMQLVDERSLPVPGVFGGRSSFGGSIEFSFSSTAPLPDSTALRVTINDGLKYHEIPFRFEDLPIPARPPAQERLEF